MKTVAEQISEMYDMPVGSVKEIACWNCEGSERHSKQADGFWHCKWCGHMKRFERHRLVESKSSPNE